MPSRQFLSDIELGFNNLRISYGTGSPESSKSADVSSIYFRSDASDSATSLYVKNSGTGNTGWTPVAVIPTAVSAEQITFIGSDGNLSTASGFVWDVSASSLGVNVASPSAAIHVYDNGSTTSRLIFETTSTANAPGVQFQWDSSGTRRSLIRAVAEGTLGASLEFFTKPDSASAVANAMTIEANGNITVEIGDLYIPNMSSGTDSDILYYDASTGLLTYGAAPSVGSSTLAGLDDVTITSVGDGEILIYDTSTSDWINQTLVEANIATASDLTDHMNDANAHGISTFGASLVQSASASAARTTLGLATVASTGDYSDLINTPTIPSISYGSSTQVPYMDGTGSGFVYTANFAFNSLNNILQLGSTSTIGSLYIRHRGAIRLYEDFANGSNYVAIQGPASTSTLTFTLPSSYGSSGDYLTSNGSGTLSWTTPSLSGFSTTNLSEGSNLYFTNERVDDRVAALLVAGSNITLTYDDGAGTLTIDAAGSGGSSTLAGLSDVTITSVGDGELLVYDTSTSDWINQTLAEAGVAAASHTHATSDITSGTFADARIAQSNVTQHQAALTITESQISDLGSYLAAGDTLIAAAGSSSNPGITFSGDTNTGIFLSGADSMQFTLGGTIIASLTTFFGTRTFTWDANIQQFNASSTLNFACPSVNVSHSNSALAGVVNLREATANGTNNISLQSPASLSANWTLTLPSDDGDANELLLTDGSGTTSWSKVAEASLDTALADKINSVKLSYLIETPADQDYPVELYIPVVATLQTIYVKTASGTCTLNVKLDGTSVTGWSAISVTSTESSTAASGANVTTVGQTLVLTISSTSSADMLSVTIVGEL